MTNDAEGTTPLQSIVPSRVCGQRCGTPSTTHDTNTNEFKESEVEHVSN
ncbi:hypothetical protein [Ralstonia sp.]